MTIRLRLVLVLIAVSALPGLSAAEPPVRMNLEPFSLRTRTGGPIGLSVKLNYNRDQLLEGNLLLKFYDGRRDYGTLLTTVRYDGIVLQGSDAVFRILLPPVPDATIDRSYDIEAWFVTDSERIPLSSGTIVQDPPDPFSLMSSDLNQRNAVLLSVSGSPDPQRISSERTWLHDMLAPYPIVPPERHRDLVWLAAGHSGYSIPEDPLELCCWDMALVTDGGFNQLEAAQLDALTHWIQAGGSLCLVLTNQGLTGRHLEFLREAMPDHASRLLLTSEGQIAFTDSDTHFCASYSGLGRCVLIPHGIRPMADLSADEQTWIREFLWKARGCRYPRSDEPLAAATGGTLRAEQDEADKDDLTSSEMLELRLASRDTGFGTMCRTVLMPSDVRMVPTSVILLLLAAYVLAVGPVDYVVLGFFRIRRYTWIVFPLVTLAFTLMMIAVAHHYLGSSETGDRLIVTDVVDEGRPVRSSVIDLQFVGTRRDSSARVTGSLISSLQSGPLTLTGRFPHEYSASRRLEQWTPEIIRTFTLSPDPVPDLGFDWVDSQLITTTQGRQQLAQVLSRLDDVTCLNAVVLHGKTGHAVVGRPAPEFDDYSIMDMDYEYAVLGMTRNESLPLTAEQGSRAPLHGMFRYFSQVSPGGAAAMEDLPLQDPGNPDQWVLMILLQTDEGYHLIRKLYCLPELSPPAEQTVHQGS